MIQEDHLQMNYQDYNQRLHLAIGIPFYKDNKRNSLACSRSHKNRLQKDKDNLNHQTKDNLTRKECKV